MLQEGEGAIQIYTDDPIFTLAGTTGERLHAVACCLILWTVCGFKISWKKAALGAEIAWIGLVFSVEMVRRIIIVRIPTKMAETMKNEALEMLQMPMVPLRTYSAFAASLGAAAGLASYYQEHTGQSVVLGKQLQLKQRLRQREVAARGTIIKDALAVGVDATSWRASRLRR